MRGHRDLTLAVATALVGAILALVLPWSAPRLIAAAPLTLFLPGYAIVAALFARQRIDRPRLIVLSVGVSLAVLALVPLALDLLPGGGVEAVPWAISLLAIVLGACRAAALRRERRPRGAVPRPHRAQLPGAAEASLFALGGIAAIVATVMIFTPFAAPKADGYTELWITPSVSGRPPAATIGVASREQRRAGYMLEIRVGGREGLFATHQATLDPGEEEVIRLPLRRFAKATPVRVGVTLFIVGQSQPYRRVAAWVPSQAER